MKYIVLYRMVLTAIMLLMITEMSGQKPAIDLIPSANQRNHPETMVDTSFASDSLVPVMPAPDSTAWIKNNQKKDGKKKERRTIGPSLDSLLSPQSDRRNRQAIPAGKHPLKLNMLNPIRVLLLIAALK